MTLIVKQEFIRTTLIMIRFDILALSQHENKNFLLLDEKSKVMLSNLSQSLWQVKFFLKNDTSKMWFLKQITLRKFPDSLLSNRYPRLKAHEFIRTAFMMKFVATVQQQPLRNMHTRQYQIHLRYNFTVAPNGI